MKSFVVCAVIAAVCCMQGVHGGLFDEALSSMALDVKEIDIKKGTITLTSKFLQMGSFAVPDSPNVAQVGTAQVGTAQVGTAQVGQSGDANYKAASSDYKAASSNYVAASANYVAAPKTAAELTARWTTNPNTCIISGTASVDASTSVISGLIMKCTVVGQPIKSVHVWQKTAGFLTGICTDVPSTLWTLPTEEVTYNVVGYNTMGLVYSAELKDVVVTAPPSQVSADIKLALTNMSPMPSAFDITKSASFVGATSTTGSATDKVLADNLKAVTAVPKAFIISAAVSDRVCSTVVAAVAATTKPAAPAVPAKKALIAPPSSYTSVDVVKFTVVGDKLADVVVTAPAPSA